MAEPGSQPRVRMRAAELDRGTNFDFRLTVTNFLGKTSSPTFHAVQRSPRPIPTLAIFAPPLLLLRPSQTVALEMGAVLSPCGSEGTSLLTYRWDVANTAWANAGAVSAESVSASANGTSGAPLVVPPLPTLDPVTSRLRRLKVDGAALLPGARYTLRATVCMSDACINGTTSIGLRQAPPSPPPPPPPRPLAPSSVGDSSAAVSLEVSVVQIAKQSPSQRLVLEASLQLLFEAGVLEVGTSLAWSIQPPHIDLSSLAVTSTGAVGPNLALRPGDGLPPYLLDL